MGRRRTSRTADALGAGLASAAALAFAAGCGGGGGSKPREACAEFEASASLNLYDGEPHPITVWVYPLSSSSAFGQTSAAELLEGALPAGAVAPAVPLTLAPGEKRSFEEVFPAETQQLGLLADYYRAPGDPEGTRTQIVKARCGRGKPKLVLSPKDIYPK